MLDDSSSIKRIDVNNMFSYIGVLPVQLSECKELTRGLGRLAKPSSLVVEGMGGSGVVGDILHDWLSREIGIPVIVNKDLALPIIDRDAMLMVISYSGNTKEALLALEDGLKRTDNVLCITSGGELMDLCSKREVSCVRVPSGCPPRCALGYLFGSAVYALKSAGIHDGEGEMKETVTHLKNLKSSLVPERKTASNPAKKIALELQDHTPIVYAYDGILSCAKRWQTQLNENAKLLSWCGALPEMSHNEIVGWDGDSKASDFAMVFLRDKNEPESVRSKFESLKRRLRSHVIEVWSDGSGRLSRMFHLIYTGDFVSYYLALLIGVNPMPVRIIEELKEETR